MDHNSYYKGQLDLAECILRMFTLILPNEAELPPFTVPQIETAKIHTITDFLSDVVDKCEIELLPFNWSETDDTSGRHSATGTETHSEA